MREAAHPDGEAQRIRCTASGAIDFDYYERRAKRLRTQAMHAWLTRLAWLLRPGTKPGGRRD